MTIYNLDLMSLTGVSELPARVHKDVCQCICLNILNHLANHLLSQNDQEGWQLFRHISAFADCMKVFNEVDRENLTLQTSVLHITVNRQLRRDIRMQQVITMGKLSDAPPAILVETMSLIMENYLICARIQSRPIDDVETDENIERIQNILTDVSRIFPRLNTFNTSYFLSITVKFKFYDQP
jgi:hypothetical protein